MRRAVQFLAVLCATALVVTLCGCGATGSPTAGSVDTAAEPGDGAGIGSPTSGSVHTAAKGGDKGKPPKEPEPGPAKPAIAFGSEGDLWVMNADGSNRRLLLAGTRLACPSWSPDGQRLVFENWDSGALEGKGLYLVNVDGTDLKALLTPDDPKCADSPAWSPEGDRIAYFWFDDLQSASDYGQIRAISPDGGDPEILYEFGADFSPLTNISWSPEADRVAAPVFSQDYEASGVMSFIGVVDLATGDLEDVTSSAGFTGVGNDSGDWARGSDLIAFRGGRDEDGGLWILDLTKAHDDPARFRQLTSGASEYPSWSPNDERLVVRSEGSLWLVDADTGDLTLLAKGNWGRKSLRCPDWRRF